MPASSSKPISRIKRRPVRESSAKTYRFLDQEKVLQVLPRLGDGGVEQSAIEMALFLMQHGVANGVTSAGGRRLDVLNDVSVPHHLMPLHRKNPLAVLVNAWHLRSLIIKHGYTIIHARSRGPAWSAWLATRGTKAKFITTFHGTYGAGNALKRFYNRIMLRSPVVIANSAFIRDHIVQTYGYPFENIIVAARGIDPEIYNAARFTEADKKRLCQELGLTCKSQKILCVGRLTRWKGQHVLIKALADLADLPNWQAVIVGGSDTHGEYARELAAMIAVHPCRERIFMVGSRSDVPALLSLATVAVSPSTRPEAFGRVAVEAQALGIPVVTTALGGSLETVKEGETGYLVAPDAPHSMAARLRELLTQPATALRLGTKARQWVSGNFTVARCCTQETLAYRRLLRVENTEI